jgi:hypothetical protein
VSRPDDILRSLRTAGSRVNARDDGVRLDRYHGVPIVERWLIGRLRDRRFCSLAELNAAIGEMQIPLTLTPFLDRLVHNEPVGD